MSLQNLAIPSFMDYEKRNRLLYQNWELMHSTGEIHMQRPAISLSWERCLSKKVDPTKMEANIVYSESELMMQQQENQNLLQLLAPYMEELFRELCHEDILIMLSDRRGIIIDGKATSTAWRKVQNIHFFPGADWSEEQAGTNAIGTAITEGKPVQVFGAEHFCQGWHSWVCSAVPIFDPVTKQLLGTLDLSGEKDRVQAHSLSVMISLIEKIQRDIRQQIMSHDMRLLQTLMDVLHEPAMIFDSQLRIVRCNRRAEYLLGLDKDAGTCVKKIVSGSYSGLDDFPFWGQKIPVEPGGCAHGSWLAFFHPYRVGDRLMGGVAVFEPIKSREPLLKTRSQSCAYQNIVTRSESMQRIIEKAKRAACSGKTLLITGETGVGKDLLAQSIHADSIRSDKRFVAVNCGAIPKELIASELFGYEAGAFTGALSKGKRGKFAMADKGTIFLDEIGELPLEAQVYLLRVLEERSVTPVGGADPIPVDVRIIAATNRDLAEEVRLGRFREDLYYRLNVLSIRIPPLRERKEDIPLLIEHFLRQPEYAIQDWIVENSALPRLVNYPWPGNIRQLKYAMDHAMFSAVDGQIHLTDFPEEIVNWTPHPQDKAMAGNGKKDSKRPPVELTKDIILEALQMTDQNVTQASRLLHVSRMTVYRKMREFGLDRTNELV
jgi:transcriptional regulator of acetoin/glycerol metabolism